MKEKHFQTIELMSAESVKSTKVDRSVNLKEKEILEGFITAVYRERYEVCVNNELIFARLKSSIYFYENNQDYPTVGDNVLIEYNATGDSLIFETKVRKSKFSRKDPDKGRGEQTIAANFDYVFIMMSLNYDFNVKRLERYITVSWQSGGTPVIILTKADIGENIDEKIAKISEAAIGTDIYTISGVTGEGIDALEKYLEADKCIVFLGSSGVGKSTLTNYLLNDEIMKTMEIREDDSKGHHTTTHRQMFLLPNGAKIIDTPGMRELGMWVVEDGMEQSFSDLVELASTCRFNNCKHEKEDGCAVKEAIKNGTLSEKRWINYQKILKESNYHAAKERINKIKEKKAVTKTMKKSSRKINLKDEDY